MRGEYRHSPNIKCCRRGGHTLYYLLGILHRGDGAQKETVSPVRNTARRTVDTIR